MVIGHSFIKDIRDYMSWSARQDGFRPAIEHNMLWQGTYNANKMRLNDLYKYITFDWAYVFQSREMEDVFTRVANVKPQALVINTASNDICNIIKFGDFGGDVDNLARAMRSRARRLRDELFIENIPFMSVIRRGKGFGDSQAVFEEEMEQFNETLTRLISHEPRMRVHKVCGFTEKDPSEWAPDKLHPTREWDTEVFDKYMQEIRATLYHAVGAMEDDNVNYGGYA